MNYLSVCSGVEAASQAWMPLGWKAVAFSEIEPFPCAVLASRFPDVPNLGDMSKIHYNKETKELANGTTTIVCRDGIDLLVGGTPCQSFSNALSIAHERNGLEGASGLALHFARLIGEIQPRWFVWENVPSAISSVTYGDQRDFNFLLHAFSIGGSPCMGVRYNCCWRVFDTQYVRVELFPYAIPQRRDRLFLVGHIATDCRSGCEVLLEQEGLRGCDTPRRIKVKEYSRNADGSNDVIDIQNFKANLAGGYTDTAMITGDHDSRITDFTNLIVTKTESIIESCEECRHYDAMNGECSLPHNDEDLCPVAMGEESPGCNFSIRRLTPAECERLQGFQDSWTRPCFTPDQITEELVDRFVAIHLEWAKINAADGAAVKSKSRKWVRDWLTKISSADCPDRPRYKAIGNSMPVNVMNWIGQVIDINDKETRK